MAQNVNKKERRRNEKREKKEPRQRGDGDAEVVTALSAGEKPRRRAFQVYVQLSSQSHLQIQAN